MKLLRLGAIRAPSTGVSAGGTVAADDVVVWRVGNASPSVRATLDGPPAIDAFFNLKTGASDPGVDPDSANGPMHWVLATGLVPQLYHETIAARGYYQAGMVVAYAGRWYTALEGGDFTQAPSGGTDANWEAFVVGAGASTAPRTLVPLDVSALGATSTLAHTLDDGTQVGEVVTIFDSTGDVTADRTIEITGRFRGEDGQTVAIEVPWGSLDFVWSATRGWIEPAYLHSGAEAPPVASASSILVQAAFDSDGTLQSRVGTVAVSVDATRPFTGQFLITLATPLPDTDVIVQAAIGPSSDNSMAVQGQAQARVIDTSTIEVETFVGSGTSKASRPFSIFAMR